MTAPGFSEDSQDGIWTKYAGNPVLALEQTERWLAPNLAYER